MRYNIKEVILIENEGAEKVILVGVTPASGDKGLYTSHIEELKGLTEAAGGKVIATIVQARKRPEASTYIGSGKIEEVKHLIEELDADTVIFDQELSPVQLRNLETRLETKVVDRTMLILDIFKQRARSKEGNLQVDLAALQYRLPRLRGTGTQLSRLGAGIGTRGAGEQKLELDRRYIRRRIQEIKQQIEKLEKTRGLHRKQRSRSGIKVIALVGYTNAGKSTLFNALCSTAHKSGHPQVEADDRLFQTLDTTTRRIDLSRDEQVLITDTVGFIRDLPHDLVAAFHSTLEEVIYADILLHVVDISDEEYFDKMQVVEEVLGELGADPDKILNVFNKADLLDHIPDNTRAVYISAARGMGLGELLDAIRNRLSMIPGSNHGVKPLNHEER